MPHTVYRIWYGNQIVYVGRTNQPLKNRIRGHVFAKPMHRVIDINQITKVDYHEFQTEADMNLYEIYLILKLHPALNVDDKTRDTLTVSLPEVEFKTAEFPIWEKWKTEIAKKMDQEEKRKLRLKELRQQRQIIRKMWHDGEITQEEYDKRLDELLMEIDTLTGPRHQTELF